MIYNDLILKILFEAKVFLQKTLASNILKILIQSIKDELNQ